LEVDGLKAEPGKMRLALDGFKEEASIALARVKGD